MALTTTMMKDDSLSRNAANKAITILEVENETR